MEHFNIMLYGGAIMLGALHAFEPGHGKTLISAYMIGTRGRAIDGIVLGLIATFTHTFSVICLGIAAYLLSRTFTEDSLHNWLGLVSAILILVTGVWMLKTRLSQKTGYSHAHLFGKGHYHEEHNHSHPHGDISSGNAHPHHDHSHDHHHDHVRDDDLSHPPEHATTHTHKNGHPHGQQSDLRHLLLLGISGGLIPCPAGIATLLAAVAAGRIAEGLTVTIFFSLGLGLVMMTIGVLLSQADRLTRKISDNLELGRRLGIVSAVIIVSVGAVTFISSLKNLLL